MELFTVQKGHCHQRRGPGLSPGLLHSALCGSLFCVERILYALGRSCVADPSCFYKKGLLLAEQRIFNE